VFNPPLVLTPSHIQQNHTLGKYLFKTNFNVIPPPMPRSSKCSGECYNERCYNERMLKRTVFINKIRMLQRTHRLQRTRKNTIGRRSKRVRVTCSIIVYSRERVTIRITNRCDFFVLCLYFLFLVFSLHVSGLHGPIIRGISSCCFYATIWFV